ncbi:MAG: hypothetical protein QOK41_857 [Sphingomonadales bacterium]|nr:hypothetical protein [Sphingomonadales bacterium]
MTGFIKKLLKDGRGNTLAIAAACLPLVVGAAGLATDTIQWTLWKRQLQRVADSAAEAGVYSIVAGNSVGTCTNVVNPAYTQPVAYDVSKNNYTGATPTCTVTNPPSTGGFTADANAVKVDLSMQRTLAFSGMFMSAAPTITASATATIVPSGQYCVVSLESAAVTGIDATGSTNVNLGCGMITNSPSMTAAVATGNSSVTASPIAAVGGIPASTHWGSGTVLQPFTVQEADPFGSVPLPTPSGCSAFPSNQPSDTISIANPTGTKCFNTTMDINGNVTLASGTYIMDAGAGVNQTNNNAHLTCSHCTIILMNSSGGSVGTVNINGGEVDMTSPNTGCTIGSAGCYDGMAFYQSRNAASDNSIRINGNANSSLEGALYFPKADLTFNGTAGMTTNCMQIVAKDVTFTGNSAITNTCDSTVGGGHSFAGKKVRLVA